MKNYISKFRKIWREILDSLKGVEQDYTSGSLKKAIVLLSIPMVLEMIMESVFAIADIAFVSRLGADAIATVGITESMITIIYAIGVGLSAGAGAVVSRRIGEKHNVDASRSAWQAIITSLTIGLFIAIPGAIFSSSLLRLMGASEIIVNSMSGYTSIMLGGNFIIILLFVINGVFRSAGDPALAMRVLWFANIINIILDPIFIFGLGPIPAMGVKGAAIATNIGRGIAVVYQFYLMFSGKGRISLKNISFRPDLTVVRKILKLSTGTVSQYLVATSSWIILVRLIATYGSSVVAGYTIAIRILMFSLLPAFGVANAAATLVGQNLGAKEFVRAEKSVFMTGKFNAIVMGIISLIFIAFPRFFISLFTTDEGVIQMGIECLRIISYGYAFYGLGMVVVHSLNGAGDTQTPFKINFVCFWLIEIPLAYLLSENFGLGQHGIYYSIIFAETLMTIIALYFFRLGKWKLKEV